VEIGFTGNGWVSSRRRIRSAAVPRLSEMDTALALEATLAWLDKKLTPRDRVRRASSLSAER
jgi:hypothetical protein